VNEPIQRSRAFLLRTVDYGESDRVLTLLSEDRGKIAAIARGARSSRKRFGGALEPFALLEVSLTRGRGSLPLLAEASLLRAHSGLSRSLGRFGAAGFVLELAREILPEHQPEPAIFNLVDELLPLLAEAEDHDAVVLALGAALRALAAAGLGVSVSECNACGASVPPGRRVYFDPRRGGVVCTSCGGGPLVVSAAGIRALVTLAREPLGAVATAVGDLEPEVLGEIEHVLGAFLEQHLERPLKSLSFLDQVRLEGGSDR
jgi:DNA repair protein RecO (recombination protein O)